MHAFAATGLHVAFVEQKKPDFERIQDLLASSQATGRWTNCGPLWWRLKDRLQRSLRLPAGRVAVPCASGTAGLRVAVAIAQRETSMRWVVPAFSFKAVTIGPFAEARAIDCDRQGLLDLNALAAVPEDSYDGIVVANPFGLHASFEAFARFARDRSKALIIDNAAGFWGIDRNDHRGIFECISLHHTKPFGFGEAGCVIVDREFEVAAMQALNFGIGWPGTGCRKNLSNGKLSDLAAAFVLDRLERAGAWTPHYRAQYDRIESLALALGLETLCPRGAPGQGVYGNVPLLASRPVAHAELANDAVVLGKYYEPADMSCRRAARIFRRIVNFPAHADLGMLTDDDLIAVMSRFLSAPADAPVTAALA